MVEKAGPAVVAVHPTAVVDPTAELGEAVEIGPYAIIGPSVVIGTGTTVGPHTVIERGTMVGENCRISGHAYLGGDPQDEKYGGEPTRLWIGDRTVIREFVTCHRGSASTGETVVGQDCYLMAYAHVAHDCRVGDGAILVNGVNMGGHSEVGIQAIVGGMTGIHQFVRVGEYAIIGGCSRIPLDVSPFTKVVGNPARLYGLNTVGLRRHGFSEESRAALKRAYRLLFGAGLPMREACRRICDEVETTPEVERLIQFVLESRRGVLQR